MSECVPITLIKEWCIRRTAENQGLSLVALQTAAHAIQRGLLLNCLETVAEIGHEPLHGCATHTKP